MKRLTSTQPEAQPSTQTAKILPFTKKEDFLTARQIEELERINEIRRIGETYQRPLFDFLLDSETTEDELAQLCGLMEHLKEIRVARSTHSHLSLVIGTTEIQ